VITTGNSAYGKGQAFVLTANYTNGGIYANFAAWNNHVEGNPGGTATAVTAATADSSAYRLSGSYKFPFGLKIGGQFDHSALNNVGQSATAAGAKNSRNAWEVPVSYAFGNNTILASYTRANSIKNTAGNNGVKALTVGYDYSLSKRTNVGVYFNKMKNDTNGVYNPFLNSVGLSGSVLLAGESATTFALGIKHTF